MRGEFLWVFFARGCAAAVECILAEAWDARKSSIEFGSGGGETRGEVLWSVWVASDARLDVLVRRRGRGSDGGVDNYECNHARTRVMKRVIRELARRGMTPSTQHRVWEAPRKVWEAPRKV